MSKVSPLIEENADRSAQLLNLIFDEYGSLTDRQKEILKIVCENRETDFQTLMKMTSKDRVTLLHSVGSLEAKNMITKQRVDPKHSKSRQIFKPSEKGFAVGIAHLRVSLDAHKRSYNLEIISHFNEIVDSVSDAPITLSHLASWLLRNNCFADDGTIRKLSKRELSALDNAIFKLLIAEHIARAGLPNGDLWSKISKVHYESNDKIIKYLSKLSEIGVAI